MPNDSASLFGLEFRLLQLPLAPGSLRSLPGRPTACLSYQCKIPSAMNATSPPHTNCDLQPCFEHNMLACKIAFTCCNIASSLSMAPEYTAFRMIRCPQLTISYQNCEGMCWPLAKQVRLAVFCNSLLNVAFWDLGLDGYVVTSAGCQTRPVMDCEGERGMKEWFRQAVEGMQLHGPFGFQLCKHMRFGERCTTMTTTTATYNER